MAAKDKVDARLTPAGRSAPNSPQVEQRWHHVEPLYDGVYLMGPSARHRKDQRHTRRVLVQIILGPACVPPERDAVIAVHDHARAARQAQDVERGEHRADLVVDVRRATVVLADGIALPIPADRKARNVPILPGDHRRVVLERAARWRLLIHWDWPSPLGDDG